MDLNRKTIQQTENFDEMSADCMKALELARAVANNAGENTGSENVKEIDPDEKTDSLAEKK